MVASSIRTAYPRGPRGPGGIPNVPRITGTLVEWQDGDGGYLPPVDYIGPQGPNGSAQRFRNRAALEASTLGAEVEAVDLLGYYEPGDFGASRWKVLLADPGTTVGVIETDNGKFLKYAEWIINVRAFGAKGDGVTDDLLAFQHAIAFAPSTGARIVVPHTDSFYKISGTIVIAKPIVFSGDGMDATVIRTSSATADIIETQVGGVVIEDIRLAATVLRTAGQCIHSTAGSGLLSVLISRVRMEGLGDVLSEPVNAGTAGGVLVGAGFLWIENCDIIIRNGIGNGVKTVNNSGLYCRDSFIASPNLDLDNQPFVGIDLSDCGNGFVTNTQMLVTGRGVMMSPSLPGQLCTSLNYVNVYADHCTVGWASQPSNSQTVSIVTMCNCWAGASVGSGMLFAPGTDGFIADLTVTTSTISSGGAVSHADGVSFGSRVGNITFANNTVFAHFGGTDVAVRGNANGILLTGNRIGNSSFQSTIGLAIADTCDHVMATQNIFNSAVTAQIQNTSSGAHNVTTPNIVF